MRSLIYYFVVVLAAIGCATPDTVEDPAETHFIRFYGTDGDQTGRDLVVLPDGSMVLFGTTRPTTPTLGTQWYVVRVDNKGKILWEREYGGSEDEEARDIEITSSGNLVLVGNSYVNTNERDIMVLVLSRDDGSVIDSAMVQSLDLSTALNTNEDDNASTITEISDGFIIAGTTTYVDPSNPPNPLLVDTHDALKIRLYSDLTPYPNTWKQIEGYDADDGYVKIIPAPAGAYGSFYAFGYSNININLNTIGYNYWVTYLGSNGDPASSNFYLGASADEKMSSFVFTGSQFIMTGLQVGASTDVYFASGFVPQSDTLVVQFEKPLGFPLGTNLSGHTAVCQAVVNGGFYILAEENGFNNNQNWILTRFNNNGTPGWSQPIVFGGEGLDSAGAVKELPDGRVVIIGTMRTGRPDAGEYKMTLAKVDGEGHFRK